jgi:hypothetical protein
MGPIRVVTSVVIAILFVFLTDRYYISYGEKTLDVNVNLSNTVDNIAKYKVHVTVYGEETAEQSKVIDTSSQSCPDDIDSLCYVNAGTFSFASKSVPVDSKIQVCVEEISSDIQNCVYGKNSEKNGPELITVGVPNIN